MDLNRFKNRKGWTQSDMGEALGVATSSVGGYCSGTRKPSYEIIEALIKHGATLSEIFSEEVAAIYNSTVAVSQNSSLDEKGVLWILRRMIDNYEQNLSNASSNG